MKLRGLSGYTLSRDCVRLDYPVIECIRSILPVCDEVVVSDGGSTDGTLELLEALCAEQPKVRVVHHRPYELFPDGEQSFNQWIELARSELRYDMEFCLEGDEILDPGSFAEIGRAVVAREPRMFTYLNFWMDAQHVCPWGDGRKLHLVPAGTVTSSHGEPPPEFMALRNSAPTHPSLITYHYTSLRKRESFFAKCKEMSRRLAWPYADQGLMQAERTGENFMPLFPDRVAATTPFTGKHPEIMHAWLIERGWKI